VSRIFFTLATFSLALLAAALLIGLLVGDLHGELTESKLRWATAHRLTGVAAALTVVLVNSIGVTYFIGTSRWCKEVVATYRLDNSLIAESTRLKRRTFPWAVIGMLTVVGISALGGAADPATGRAGTADWVIMHFLGALTGVSIIVVCYLVQWNNIVANHRIITQIMSEVGKIRAERGLEVHAET
jgi:hypothetical protein